MELRDKNGLTEKEFLAAYDVSKFERPSVTVDIICIRHGRILLIRRGGHPFLGRLALPGGFLEPDENAYAAAARELFEETGLKAKNLRMLRPATDPGRDPRTRIVTVPFLADIENAPGHAAAGDDAAAAGWYDITATRSSSVDGMDIVISDPDSGERVSYAVIRTRDKTGLCGDVIYRTVPERQLAGDHAALIALAVDELCARGDLILN